MNAGLLSAVLVIALVCGAFGKTITVQGGDVAGLSNAIKAAQNGDVVLLESGTYSLAKSLVISNKVGIILAGKGNVSIRVNDVYEDVISVINSDKIIISNIQAQHTTPLKEYSCDAPVVRIADSKTVLVTHCELNGCGAIGVSAENTAEVTVVKCYIHHNSFTAFYFYTVKAVFIYHSKIVDNGGFMEAYDVGQLQMFGNTTEKNVGYWDSLK